MGVCQRAIDHAEGIEGLLILTPTNVPDETRVVVNDALAPYLEKIVGPSRVAQIQLVDLGALRISSVVERHCCNAPTPPRVYHRTR